jgi:hypothetical protein
MNAISQGYQTAPAPRVTLDAEIQSLYDAIVNLSSQIDLLEAALRPVIHQSPPEEQKECRLGVVMPPAIESLRGLRESVEAYVRRLADISSRVAL